MSSNFSVVAENNIKAGQLDNFKALIKEMDDTIKRDEPGTLNYEWFLADDGKTVHACERYVDSEAFMIHLGNLIQKKYAEGLHACLSATKITIYGNPSDQVRAVFARYPTTYMSALAGVAQ